VPIAERGKVRLHYETFGEADAPPLLLIMGMGFSSRAWGELPVHLAERYRVIVYDNRGTGRSTSAGLVFRVKDMADDAAAVLDAAGAWSAFVFGISMGGMVAMELALGHPERVKALVLGATFAGWLGSRKPSLLTSTDVLVGGLLSRLGAHRMLGRALVSRATAKADPKALSRFLDGAERAGPGLLLQQMTAVTLHASASRLSGITAPTLVLTGDEDRLVPEANSRRLAELIPGARFVLLPGAGHCFPLERFEETFRELTRFFDGRPAARTPTASGRRRGPSSGPPSSSGGASPRPS
jgi:pimeloyl-ACP methyl ester carboxylesterase